MSIKLKEHSVIKIVVCFINYKLPLAIYCSISGKTHYCKMKRFTTALWHSSNTLVQTRVWQNYSQLLYAFYNTLFVNIYQNDVNTDPVSYIFSYFRCLLIHMVRRNKCVRNSQWRWQRTLIGSMSVSFRVQVLYEAFSVRLRKDYLHDNDKSYMSLTEKNPILRIIEILQVRIEKKRGFIPLIFLLMWRCHTGTIHV